MKLIDGKQLSESIYRNLEINIYKDRKLGIILANDDESSRIYVNLKIKKAEELGIKTELIKVNTNSSSDTMLSEVEHAIDTFNKSSKVTGFILQLPLDNKIKSESNRLINLINPIKDVDGLTSINLGKVSHLDKSGFIPATVEGILECINYTLKDRVDWFDNPKNNELSGKTIVIINNSNLIGKPLANILTNQNSSVSILNEYSKDIKTFTQNADIVISATGQGLLFDHTYFKDGVTLIDVTSKKVDNKIVGDFIISKELEEKASWVTPVPGGVGPLTVAFLMKNLVRL